MAMLGSLVIALAMLLLPCIYANSNLFREYIGADSDSIRFTDVPINPDVEFHFILAFAIDYQGNNSTNGRFNIFWNEQVLSPANVASIKTQNQNVKIAVSLGGDSTDGGFAYFDPQSVSSWVENAAKTLSSIIQEYHIDGIDIDYEHFKADPSTFADCMGQLVTTLKKKKLISFASIAPFEDDSVQSHYLELWRRHGGEIDYVNFQFYAYDKGINVSQFLHYFDEQSSNYEGGKVLVSFISDGGGGLPPGKEFLEACEKLKREGRLEGVFVWCADDSKKFKYQHEKEVQDLLASS